MYFAHTVIPNRSIPILPLYYSHPSVDPTKLDGFFARGYVQDTFLTILVPFASTSAATRELKRIGTQAI